MRILHFLGLGQIPTRPFVDTTGGIERVALEIARVQARRGDDVTVAVMSPTSWQGKWEGVTLQRVVPSSWGRFKFGRLERDYRSHLGMAGFARAGRYDVLHLHEYRHTRFLKALPKVMHHHNDPFGNIDMNVPSHVTQYWDQLSKNQALVAVSKFVGERLHALRDRAGAGAVPTRIMVNQSGVDATMIGDAQRQQSRAELRRELGLKDRDVMFLFAGALRSEKGVVQLARAFNKLAAEHEDAVLVLAGGKKLWVDNDPPQETAELQVHALLKDQVGARRVFLPGIVSSEAMPAYYAAADVFVLHSMFQEAFGLVILESFLAGVPVIGARSGAIPELVKDGRTGLLVDQGDVDGLCDAMRRLLLDRGLREELGAAGRQIALDMSWDKTVDRMEEIYRTVLGGRARAA